MNFKLKQGLILVLFMTLFSSILLNASGRTRKDQIRRPIDFGNPGNYWVCRDNSTKKITKIESLDIWVLENVGVQYNNKVERFDIVRHDNTSALEQAKVALKKIENYNSILYEALNYLLHYIHRKIEASLSDSNNLDPNNLGKKKKRGYRTNKVGGSKYLDFKPIEDFCPNPSDDLDWETAVKYIDDPRSNVSTAFLNNDFLTSFDFPRFDDEQEINLDRYDLFNSR